MVFFPKKVSTKVSYVKIQSVRRLIFSQMSACLFFICRVFLKHFLECVPMSSSLVIVIQLRMHSSPVKIPFVVLRVFYT